jgi:hypothetical protein
MDIQLGQIVKDQITGFQGVVTGKCQYITGCNQALVIPKVKDDGTKTDGAWFDEDRLEIVNEKPITLNKKTANGFDMAPPVRS